MRLNAPRLRSPSAQGAADWTCASNLDRPRVDCLRDTHFLPSSEELADVVNQAGMWVKDRDEKVGNRYYQVIDHRCAKTKIGQADIAKHWFVDQIGPWSTAEEEAYRAMHKELETERSP